MLGIPPENMKQFTPTRIALIDGVQMDYDILHNMQYSEFQMTNLNLEYLGRGVIHSINNQLYTDDTLYHFYREKKF